MSRCFLVAVDESHEQTLRIIKHQNDRAAGGIDKKEEKVHKILFVVLLHFWCAILSKYNFALALTTKTIKR
jgi:hypothetical protein